MTKILLIEDDPFIRGVYEKILLKESFDVLVAKDGKEGLKKAKADVPDLIILDMLMPEMDGIQFLEAYDQKNKHPDVKIVVLSNMLVQDKVNRALELGASAFKTKALFSPQELIDLINKTLHAK